MARKKVTVATEEGAQEVQTVVDDFDRIASAGLDIFPIGQGKFKLTVKDKGYKAAYLTRDEVAALAQMSSRDEIFAHVKGVLTLNKYVKAEDLDLVKEEEGEAKTPKAPREPKAPKAPQGDRLLVGKLKSRRAGDVLQQIAQATKENPILWANLSHYERKMAGKLAASGQCQRIKVEQGIAYHA